LFLAAAVLALPGLLGLARSRGGVVYPLVGFSIPSLAVLSGRSLARAIIGLVGAMGAAAFGLALDASTAPSGANRRSVPNGDSARLCGRDSAPNGGGSRKPSER
jgi:hypothetical protein